MSLAELIDGGAVFMEKSGAYAYGFRLINRQIGEKTMAGGLSAEEMLEQIFYYMTKLADERGFTSTIQLLTDMGRTLVGSDRASFWYWDRRKQQYWTLAAVGSERITVPEGTGIVGATIANNEVILLNHPYDDSRFNETVDKTTGYVTKSILCMPVKNSHGEVIGAYQAINKLGEETAGFDEVDVKHLTLAAVYCGKALESHMLYHEARVDQLTGLTNRRGFYEYYSDVVRPQLEHSACAIIMCDIDFFKKVNDTYGHNAGDAVLMHVADLLNKELSGRGEVIRWGGEEFICLLPEQSRTSAIRLAEQIRSAVEASVCRYENLDICITMSFGVHELDACLSPDENVERVDARLYRAKTTGRNRVVAELDEELK